MVAFDGSERCGEAEAYYHDFLDNENRPPVPASVTDHIQSCGRCRERLARLREILSETADALAPGPSWRNGRLVAELQAHFECLGQPITCTCVKPFLPNLLIGSIKIRIPTPVTVHVDYCPECSRDLESLRQLDLDAGQLARLSRFYAEGSTGGSWDCLRVQSGPERSVSNGTKAIPCADISWSDIFDCLLCGVEIADESGPTARQETCRAHVWSCALCLERTRELYGALRAIAERPDSEIVTVCSATQEVSADAGRVGAPYEGYPLDVQVLSHPAAYRFLRSGASSMTSKRHPSHTRSRPFLKMAALAAAMIPLAILLFVNRPISASGPTARDIDRRLAQAMNVHMAQFGSDPETPTQEFWASRAQGILISKTADLLVAYDLKRRHRSAIEAEQVTERDVPLDQDAYDRARRRMEGLLGPSLSSGPWDSELSKIEDPAHAAVGVEVYELAWERSRHGGPAEPRKWRFYVDAKTNLPRKAEFFQWDPIEKKLSLATTRRFAYPPEGDTLRRAARLFPPD